ncbi:hypothetical protein ACFVRR_15195 [Gottfriedia sp. NPDC057948]|uniref:hypothetical protein n=1 Tax=Gottfriedia sp. NPDC057948 TaxID=3346287 RepID=UPI0036D9CFA1
MAIIFPAVWLGIILPILLSIVFGILKPIVKADNTGISMIIIALLIAVLDGYIGIKMFNKFQMRFEKRKR